MGTCRYEVFKSDLEELLAYASPKLETSEDNTRFEQESVVSFSANQVLEFGSPE